MQVVSMIRGKWEEIQTADTVCMIQCYMRLQDTFSALVGMHGGKFQCFCSCEMVDLQPGQSAL